MGTIDAKKLFETENSQIAMRDRADYSGRFDAMPPGLQQWWVDRAARFALSTHTNGERQ